MTHAPATQTIRLATLGLLCFTAQGQASQGDTPATPPETQAQPVQIIEADEPAVTEAIQTDQNLDNADTPTTQAKPITEPKPISMDRSDWPTILITPVDGSVTHNPHFTGNPPMGDDIISPLHAPDPVWQIQESLDGANANNLNSENLIDLATQPFIGLAQFIAIPVRAIIDNPLSKTTSP